MFKVHRVLIDMCCLNSIFQHLFYGAAQVRREIAEETDRITGRTKMISPVPIHLSIFSPNGKSFYS